MRVMALIAFVLAVFTCSRADAADVTLTAKDGTKIHATYEPSAKGTNGQGVVLVHADKRSSTDWKFLVSKLSQTGFAAIAPDLRGQGANIPKDTTPPTQTEAQYQAMVQDVTAAMDYLKSKGVRNISLIGATLGANLALQAAAPVKEVTNVILLSPGLTYQGVSTSDALARYGERPLLQVVSKDDGYAAKSALVLDSQAKGKKHLEVYPAAGNGATMLNREPGLESLILSWLLGTYALEMENTTQAPKIEIGKDKPIETTGEKLFE